MGVSNRNEIHYKNPEHMSSTESLNIPTNSSQNSVISSSTESIQIPRISTRRQKRHKITTESPVCSPRNAGRRRLRRFKAVAELSALIEENEEQELFLEEGIPHNSSFTTFMDNPDLEHIWEHFTADNETKQLALIYDSTDVKSKLKSPVASYTNISLHIKMTFKVMRNMYELEKTEKEILDFFTNSPGGTYINSNKSSFQRLLIHGIAQYYCLKSTSFDAEDGKRIIKVENTEHRNFCDKRLCSIVQDNHNKRI